jgi:phosphoserine phosphatase RsbU/P
LLLKSAVTLARTTTSQFLVKSTLQTILQVANQVSGAEVGSLFLIDKSGVFVESILARGPVIQEVKQNLIGQVLREGLAGWVYRNHQVGLIEDTRHDDRWVRLLDQPYETRSALAVPFMRNKAIIGILTLMHQEAGYFTESLVQQLLLSTETMTLLIENAQLQASRIKP